MWVVSRCHSLNKASPTSHIVTLTIAAISSQVAHRGCCSRTRLYSAIHLLWVTYWPQTLSGLPSSSKLICVIFTILSLVWFVISLSHQNQSVLLKCHVGSVLSRLPRLEDIAPRFLFRVGSAETTPVVVVPPPLWHGCGLRLSALPISPYGETAWRLWASLALHSQLLWGGQIPFASSTNLGA